VRLKFPKFVIRFIKFQCIVCILLGISPASDCDLPTFRNLLSVPSSKAGCRVLVGCQPLKMNGFGLRVGRVKRFISLFPQNLSLFDFRFRGGGGVEGPVARQSSHLYARLSGLLRCMLYLYIIQHSVI
jgi:hypothetical protein